MEEFKNYLEDATNTRINPVMLTDIDDICAPMYEELGIDEDIRIYLNELAQKDEQEHGEYCIKANVVLKRFGIVSENQGVDKIRRSLERAGVLKPKDKDNDDDLKKLGIIEKNRRCKVVRKKVKKNNRSYYTITYYITKDALFKSLNRCHNDDKYADYFSLQWRISALLKTHQAEHARVKADNARLKAESEHETTKFEFSSFRMDVLGALGMLHADNQTLHADNQMIRADNKLTHAKLDGNRTICKDIIKRTKAMKASFDQVKDHLTQKNAKATLDPSNESLHHGYAITDYTFSKSGTRHWNIIGGQRKYVDRQTTEHVNQRRRSIFTPFTYIANPIDYRNNLCKTIIDRRGQIVIEVNARLIEEKATQDILRREQITVNSKEQTDARVEHANAVESWNHPMVHIKSFNRKISSDVAAYNQALAPEIKAHNERVGNRRGETRSFSREKRFVRDYKLITEEDVRRYMGFDLDTPPSLERFISAERIQELNEENARLELEIALPANEITDDDIPIQATPLACTWRENPYWSYDDFISVFEQVRIDTQEVSCDVDESVFDINAMIEKMDREEDDLLQDQEYSSSEEDE